MVGAVDSLQTQGSGGKPKVEKEKEASFVRSGAEDVSFGGET